jgi:hypothetical protein
MAGLFAVRARVALIYVARLVHIDLQVTGRSVRAEDIT